MKIKNAYKVVRLKNGLTLILYRIKDIQSVYISCAVKSGNYYIQDKADLGIAHFLEHLAFSYTEKFGKSENLVKAVYEIGGYLNAATDMLGTKFWIKVPFMSVKEAIDILYQLVFRSVIRDGDLEKERKIILNECRDNYANPNWVFEKKIRENRFKDLAPYYAPTTGNVENILSITKERIVNWKNKFLNPNNIIMSVVGNFAEDEVVGFIEKTFGNEKGGMAISFPRYDSDKYSDYLFYVQPEKSNQIYFDINWPAFGWCEVKRHDEAVLAILSHIIGRGPISKLHLVLRGRLNIVYSCNSYRNIFPYLGMFGVYGSTSVENLQLVFKTIRKILEEIILKGVKKADFVRIIKYLDLSNYMSFETPESISDYLLYEMFDYGEIWDPEDYSEERKKIKISEVGDMLKRILAPQKLNVNFKGDIDNSLARKVADILR